MKALFFICCSPFCVKGICHSHADRLQKDSDPPGENAELCDHPSNPKTSEEGEQGRVHPGLSGDCWNHPQPTCHYFCLHLYFYLTLDSDMHDQTFHRGKIYFPDTASKMTYCSMCFISPIFEHYWIMWVIKQSRSAFWIWWTVIIINSYIFLLFRI